jgi:uncharacterized protein (DUF342 family)
MYELTAEELNFLRAALPVYESKLTAFILYYRDMIERGGTVNASVANFQKEIESEEENLKKLKKLMKSFEKHKTVTLS